MSDYVDWTTLGKILGIGLGAGAGFVVVFALGVVGIGQFTDHKRSAGLVAAVVCFLVCAGAIAYGITVMMAK